VVVFEQTFIGLSPSVETGVQFRLDMEHWFALTRCMQALIDDEDHVFRQEMDEATSRQAASDIRDALANEACAGFLRSFLRGEYGFSSLQQHDADVCFHVDLLRQYAAFLDACGGCRWGY
jgi:uncharacterized protein with von Willebrand factor type A (vWA) domain